MNQIELEQEVQRFASEFISRVSSATEALTERPERAALRRQALNRVLLYTSSALDIASGPMPEVNLLDMAVFVRLSRSVLESHLIPHVFGDLARPLLDAFQVSEREIWELAQRTLNPPEVRQLAASTERWLEAHPHNVNVEMVRFREFAAVAGELREGSAREASGLLSRVKATVETADQAVMITERALFLAQRMPFLLRLQARVGAQDVVMDSALSLRASRIGWSLVGFMAAVGGAWALSFWGGYYLARKKLRRPWERVLAF